MIPEGTAMGTGGMLDVSASGASAVLIVDDDPDISQALMDLLEHEGYHVQAAGSGAEALEKGTRRRYSAVILDLGLPDIDGLVVLKELVERDPKLPVIVLTAFTGEDKSSSAMSRGAFAFLTKPYNRDQLKATLNRAIGVSALATKAEHIEHALTESEERFHCVVQSATDAIILADHRGRIISWNKGACRLFLYSEEEVLGRPLSIIMPIRYRTAHQQGLERVLSTGQSRLIGKVVELHGLRKDGREFPIELSVASWKTSKSTFFSGIIRDITERKQTESALRESEERYRLALSAGRLGTWDWNVHTGTVTWSENVESFFGLPQGTFEGTYDAFVRCIHPDDRQSFRHAIAAALEGRQEYELEHRVIWPDRGCHWVSCRGRVIRDAMGKAARMLGTIQCITARKQAEDVLQGLKRQHQSILEAAGDGIYGLDTDGRTTFVNPAAVRMLQWTAEELVNVPMHSLLHHTKSDGSPYPAEACPIYAACRDGGVHAVDHEVFWRKDGTCFPVEYLSTPIREEGRVVGAVVVFKDITERKRAQDAIRASENLTQQILASSQDSINVLDMEGRLLFINQAGRELMNIRDLAGVLNMSWMDLWGGRDREAATAAFETAKAGGVGQFAGYCLTMAGEPRWWDVIVTPMCDVHGKPERLVAISRDMTERKRMEDALRESEERFRQVTENIREVFWMTDPGKQEMLYVSPAYEEIWGRSCGSLYRAPLSWLDAIHPDDLERVRQAAMADQAGGGYVEEYRIVRPDGTIRWIRDRAFPVHNASGVVYRIAGIAEDVTALHGLLKT